MLMNKRIDMDEKERKVSENLNMNIMDIKTLKHNYIFEGIFDSDMINKISEYTIDYNQVIEKLIQNVYEGEITNIKCLEIFLISFEEQNKINLLVNGKIINIQRKLIVKVSSKDAVLETVFVSRLNNKKPKENIFKRIKKFFKQGFKKNIYEL